MAQGINTQIIVEGISGGEVQGPNSSTDNALVRFDGTTGKIIQNSGATLDDTGLLNTTKLIVGDSGTESSGINILGTTYESSFKVSDIDGTNYAQNILHRHSTTLQPVLIGARSNTDTSAHADVTNSMGLFSIYGVGYAGSNYKIFGSIDISAASTGTISNTSAPGRISMSIPQNGSTVPSQMFLLSGSMNSSFIGYLAGQYSTGSNNIGIGYLAMNGVNGSTTATDTVAIGPQAGQYKTTGNGSFYFGNTAGSGSATNPNTGSSQFFAGNAAGRYITSANSVAIGYQAMMGTDGGSSGGGGIAIGQSSLTAMTTAAEVIAIGGFTMQYKSSGNFGVALGDYAGGASNTYKNTGTGQAYFGSFAGRYAIGSYNVAQGYKALNGVDGVTTANYIVAQGYQAGYYKTTGDYSVFIGYNAGIGSDTYRNAGAGSICVGYQAGSYMNGGTNVIIGYLAGTSVDGLSLTSFNNIIIGNTAGRYKTTNNNNVLIGAVAGSGSATYPMVAESATYIGNSAGSYATGNYNTAVGFNALTGVDGSTTAIYTVAMGAGAGQYKTTGDYSVMLGYNSGAGSATNPNAGVGQMYVGRQCGVYATGSYNLALGSQSLLGVDGVTTCQYTISLGAAAGYYKTTGDHSIFMGYLTGQGSNTYRNTGAGQTYIGREAGKFATGNYNIGIGYQTMLGVDGSTTATYGVAVGYKSQNALTTGSYNVTLGYQSGDSITTGGKNIILGYNADIVSATDSDKLVIDNTATATRFIYGDMTSSTANRFLQLDGRLYTSGITMLSTDTFKLGTTATSDYGWDDYTSEITVRGSGPNDPTWAVFRNGLYAYSFSAGTMNQCWLNFHIKHDYAEGTAIYPHVHWSPTTTSTGTVRWGIEYTVAKGHQQATGSDFAASTTVYVEQTIASNKQYIHHVAEVALADVVPSTKLEPDSLIIMRIFRDAAHVNDTFPDSVSVFTGDLHFQVSKFATKNKAPDFNT